MTVQKQPDPLVKQINIDGNKPPTESKDSTTVISEITERRKKQALERLEAADIERMTLEAENDVSRLRGNPPSRHNGDGSDTRDTEEERQRRKEVESARLMNEMANKAKALIDAGIDPRNVSSMLMGLMPQVGASTYQQQPINVPKNGFDFDDFIKFWKLLNENKTNDELKQALVILTKEVATLKADKEKKTKGDDRNEPVDPLDYLLNTKEKFDRLNDMFGNKEGNTKRTMEEIKEENRHNEEMIRLKQEQEHKEKLVNIATDIPKRIGESIAERMRDGESLDGEQPDSPPSERKTLEKLKCEDCGTDIYVPFDTIHVSCPKCGSKYDREVIVQGGK